MSPIQAQLAREARWDAKVACAGLFLFFVFGLVLPGWTFWVWFTPMAAFWFRYLWVRCRRDEELLRADVAAGGGVGAPGCYRSELGICITDGREHVLVLRDQADTLLKLPHIGGRE